RVRSASIALRAKPNRAEGRATSCERVCLGVCAKGLEAAVRPCGRLVGLSRVTGRTALIMLGLLAGSCATIRVTDPTRSATEQFLQSEATRKAVDQLSAEALRDRKTFLDTSYLITAAYPTPENLFLVDELRSRLLV